MLAHVNGFRIMHQQNSKQKQVVHHCCQMGEALGKVLSILFFGCVEEAETVSLQDIIDKSPVKRERTIRDQLKRHKIKPCRKDGNTNLYWLSEVERVFDLDSES